MSVRRFLLLAPAIAALSIGLAVSNQAGAQAPDAAGAIDRVPLFDSLESRPIASPSDVSRSKMTVAELRQARALYRANQRVARLEYNLWMGIEPLRPKWNSIPMMSSRYGPRKLYVPVYVYQR